MYLEETISRSVVKVFYAVYTFINILYQKNMVYVLRNINSLKQKVYKQRT